MALWLGTLWLVSKERLRRLQRWWNGVAIFAALSISHAFGYHAASGPLFWIAFLSPFAVIAAAMWRLDRWARRSPVPQEWPQIACGVKAATGLRGRWWESPAQIARAWLVSGVFVGAVELAVYRDLTTALFAAVTFPAIVLGACRWRHRSQERRALPLEGWYADPAAKHERRYWDGEGWTQFVLDAGTQSVDLSA